LLQTDEELRTVVARWQELPPHIKAAVLVLVGSRGSS
jgi:hypothetical protein